VALTSITNIKDALQAQFISDWAAQTEVSYDNDDYGPPNDDTPWVRFSIQFDDGEQVSMGGTGSRGFRYYGWIVVQVFTPIGNGKTSDNDGYCENAKNIFEGESISGIWFRDAHIRYVGPDGKWFQQNVNAQFIYTITK